jgi:hypothetical protein
VSSGAETAAAIMLAAWKAPGWFPYRQLPRSVRVPHRRLLSKGFAFGGYRSQRLSGGAVLSRQAAAGMAKKPDRRSRSSGKSARSPAKHVWLGDVEAPDEAAAMEKAAAEFNVPAKRLMALRR